jgi:hypothetical protein
MMIEIKEFYWAHREIIRIASASGGMLLLQLFILLWTIRRLRELSHIRERMSRLADGLALLTDTTEAGLSTIIREVQQLSRRSAEPRPAPRAAVAKRVTAAVRNGEDIARIAETESLSESEVRLHLSLGAQAQRGRGQEHLGAL